MLKELRIVTEVKIIHTLKNINNTFLPVLLTKSFVVMINLVSQSFFTEEEIQLINLLKRFLMSIIIVKMR